jgi:hypothetical protein
MSLLRLFWRFIVWIAEAAVACLAGVLPRRHWPRLDERFPVTSMAGVSAIVTFFAAAAIGIPGYFRYVQSRTDLIVSSLLAATTGLLTPGANPRELLSEQGAQMVWVSGYFAPFTFALLTPTGLVSFYLTLTGYYRLAAWYVESPQGDPVLTLIDSFIAGRRIVAAGERAKEARERLEGPEVPDRLVTGKSAGIPDAELVVVASRRKPGWEAGVFLISSGTWYRLGLPEERMLPSGLRTFYPMNELKDLEVRRRSVEYELPPLSGSPSSQEGKPS